MLKCFCGVHPSRANEKYIMVHNPLVKVLAQAPHEL